MDTSQPADDQNNGKASPPKVKSEAEVRREEAREKERVRMQRDFDLMLTAEDVDWQGVHSHASRYPGLTPNAKDHTSGVTTLHRASYDGEVDILRWCLLSRADISARTVLGRSALHYACDGNQPGCVRLLLESEADPNAVTLSGMAPLHASCVSNSFEATVVLLNESKQVVSVDTEDGRRHEPVALTKDPNIVHAIENYKRTLQERRTGSVDSADLISFEDYAVLAKRRGERCLLARAFTAFLRCRRGSDRNAECHALASFSRGSFLFLEGVTAN